MCRNHIIESVKRDAIESGQVDQTNVVANLAHANSSAGATQSLSCFSRVLDLTHTLTPEFPTFTGLPALEVEETHLYSKDKLNMRRLSYVEHVGTHIDAPIHFSADGETVEEIPVEQLVCSLVVVDVREKVTTDRNYRLTPQDIRDFESMYGKIPVGACVAMLSGWDKRLWTSEFRGADEEGILHFPGFHLEAAEFLLHERQVVGLGVDTLSLDFGPSVDSPVHHLWLPSGRYGIEGLANLAEVPSTGATLIVGAPKFEGSTGGPSRVLALI